MESFAGTLLFASFALAVAFACGYGPVTFLLPAEHRHLRWVAMPTTGYLALCLLVMVVSGNLGVSVNDAVIPAFGVLLAIGAAAWVRRRASPGSARPEAMRLAALMTPTLLVVTGPMFIQSAELYLGSANLDFYQSLVYQEILRKNDLSVFAFFDPPTAAHSVELSAKVWPDRLQARFGGVMFSYLLQSLTGVSAKASLTMALLVFAACVPLSFYIFSRVVMGLNERTAIVCAVLAGISSPIALSFLYILVGQGSGLPVLPLLICVLFLALRQTSFRLLAYAALLVAGLFWLYAMMLPFALAPMGLLALYLMGRRRLPIWWAFAILLGAMAAFAFAWAGMLEYLLAFFRGLAEVAGRLVGTFFFVDFLTEMFFVYLLGITSYPASSSILSDTIYRLAGDGVAWGVTIVAVAWVIAFYVASLATWLRRERDEARRAAMLSIIAVYVAVWVYFSFITQYGYSVFKMTAWLQYLVIPVMAFGLAHFLGGLRAGGAGRAWRGSMLAAGLFFAGSNLVAAVDYGVISFGTNRERGYIVNAFGVGDNPDWKSVGADVATVASGTKTVGLTFTDAIQNSWAAYRLMGRMPHSILSHEQLPEDDAFLPDPISGDVSDTSGELKRVETMRYEDVRNDFYLLPGRTNLNPEITAPQQLPPPDWSNGTYQLQAGAGLSDFLFLGRGFYRAEFARSANPWWQPRGTSRWSRDGGEFFILQASQPGKPYRLKFTAMVGFGLADSGRTLEFYHGGVKFDEVRISNTARIVSKPFYPAGKLDKITVVIREKTRPMTRRVGLWGMDLPDDSRLLNMQVSSAQLLGPDHRPAVEVGGRLAGNDILEKAYLFDGLSVDLWVGAHASLAFVAPIDRPTVRIDAAVPANLGFTFPFALTILADGVPHRFEAPAPGKITMRVPVPAKARGEVLTLEIRPQSHREVNEPFARKNRPVLQSVHLQSIDFEAQP